MNGNLGRIVDVEYGVKRVKNSADGRCDGVHPNVPLANLEVKDKAELGSCHKHTTLRTSEVAVSVLARHPTIDLTTCLSLDLEISENVTNALEERLPYSKQNPSKTRIFDLFSFFLLYILTCRRFMV